MIINRAVFEALPELLAEFNIIHQTGSASETKKRLHDLNLSPELARSYVHQPYFYGDEIGEVLNEADIIISRAGANTVTEILALAKPTIFIPIPWVAGNEQYMNAEFAKDLGIGTIIEQKTLNSDHLISEIKTVYSNLSQNKGISGSLSLEEAKSGSRQAVNLNAAETIAKELVSLVQSNS